MIQLKEVISRASNQDIIIKAAAVADYTPEKPQNQKIKKNQNFSSIPLKKTKDILKYLGENKKENQVLCGFSMETQDLIDNSQKKLESKNLDIICANSINSSGSGFKNDTNIITIITKDKVNQLEKMSKLEAAEKIFDEILKLNKDK